MRRLLFYHSLVAGEGGRGGALGAAENYIIYCLCVRIVDWNSVPFVHSQNAKFGQ